MTDHAKEAFEASLNSIHGWDSGESGNLTIRAKILFFIHKLKRRWFYLRNPRARKVERLVAKVTGLCLTKDSYLLLAPPEYAHGPVFISGGINTTLIYNVFDNSKLRGINSYVQVKMHVMLPNRVEFEARQTIKDGVKLEQPITLDVYADYKAPGLFLLDSLSNYFPGYPVVVERKEEPV